MTSTKETLDSIFSTDYNKFLEITQKLVTAKDNATDILHSCIVVVYELPEDKVKKVLPYFNFYFVHVLKRACQSKSSPYQQANNKMNIVENWDYEHSLEYTEPEEDSDIPDYDVTIKDLTATNADKMIKFVLTHDKLDCFENFSNITANDLKKFKRKVLSILNKCNWYDREVYLRYVQSGDSFKTMHGELKIPACSLYYTYKKVKEIIIKELYLK